VAEEELSSGQRAAVMTRVRSIYVKIFFQTELLAVRKQAVSIMLNIAARNRSRPVNQSRDLHGLIAQIIPVLNWSNSKPKALTGSVGRGLKFLKIL
jgi:hypothetical protein